MSANTYVRLFLTCAVGGQTLAPDTEGEFHDRAESPWALMDLVQVPHGRALRMALTNKIDLREGSVQLPVNSGQELSKLR